MERFSIGNVLTAGARLGAWSLVRFAPLLALCFIPGAPLPVLFAVDVVLAALVSHAVVHRLRGTRPSLRATVAAAFPRLPHVAGLIVLVYVTVAAIGFAIVFPTYQESPLVARTAFVIWCLFIVFLYARWFVLVPAIVLEREGLGAFARSGELTADRRWPIASIVFLFVATLVGYGLVLDHVGAGREARNLAWGAIWAVGSVFRASIAAAAYHYLRQDLEAASPEQLGEVFD